MSLSATPQQKPDALPLAPRRSLAPQRYNATPLDQLCSQLIDDATDSTLAQVFAQGMIRTTEAVAAHFPDNIFADVDFLAAALLTQTRRQADPTRQLAAHFDQITGLIQLYGCHSAICFRYMHDFLYGFDWARWVRKDPQARGTVGPFDPVFLDYLHQRGGELLALIARDDPKYPPLPPGQWRNSFGFSRTPADETRLHQALAAADLLPIAAWDPKAQPTCDRDFHQLRQQRATQLNG